MPARISLIGFGVRGVDQLTLEGLEELQKAQVVLYFQVKEQEIDKLRWLMAGTDTKFECIEKLYRDGGIDSENYSRICDYIYKVASERSPVAVLIQGHPLFGVSFAQVLTDVARNGEVSLNVISAPSSFDAMTVDLCRDPLEKGTLVIDVNRLLLFDIRLCPEIDTYFYHICSVGTARTHVHRPLQDNQLGIFEKLLQNTYPAGHPVHLVSASPSREKPATIVSATIETFRTLDPHIHFGTTLFIPGIRPQKVNQHFLNLIAKSKRDPAHKDGMAS